jgi:hypothetical protein
LLTTRGRDLPSNVDVAVTSLTTVRLPAVVAQPVS